MQNSNAKTNTILLIVLIILVLGIGFVLINKDSNKAQVPVTTSTNEENVISGIEGNKDDLISFSIKTGGEIDGNFKEKEYTGSIKGGYFFEGNILVNVLDSSKKLLRSGYASAVTDWMTAGPVSFQGFLNLSGLPKGKAYIEIHNDNASGLPENDKSILIPIIIK